MKKKESHIRNIVTGLLRTIEKRSSGKGKAVNEAWTRAVGEEASKHARPGDFRKGILTVIAENSAWMYQLRIEKKNIIEEFNKNYTGRAKARDIRFRQGGHSG